MFERLRRLRPDRRRGFHGPADAPADAASSLDPYYSFSPRGFDLWSFSRGSVFYNGEEVEEMVDEPGKRVGELLDLSWGLSEYRQFLASQGRGAPAELILSIDLLHGKIAKRLTGIYEYLTSGVHVEKNGERFWVNNIDVSALMKLYRVRPTPKAHAYLKGFRDKLALILSQRNGNGELLGGRAALAEIVDELTNLLSIQPANHPLLLVASSGGNQ